MKRGIVVIVVMVLAAVPVFADDVYLRGGGQITGEIIEQSEDSVTIDIGGGTMTARRSSIVRIEESISPLQEYRTRAETIPDGDAEAWRALAQWATGEALSSQAAEAYTQVVTILPNDQQANDALGRVQLGGKWVSQEDAYRAQGYIEFEGHWMTPAERQLILTERLAIKKADRKANEDAIRAIEADQEAEAQREREEAERDDFGNSVYWGWGAGPGTWPVPSGPMPTNPADGPGAW